jgi:hypothetical protein
LSITIGQVAVLSSRLPAIALVEGMAVMITGKRVRHAANRLRHYRLEEPVGQLIWLVSVILFAGWAHFYYEPPAGAIAWIGMTIWTSVFAVWGQVAREWFAMRWWRQ